MTVKIAFIGTHGTGKTTRAYELCQALSKRGYRVTFNEEIARKCPLPINENSPLETEDWILSAEIKHEVESSYKYEVVVCDRSVLDSFAYKQYRIGENNPRTLMWKTLVREWMKTYTHLFYTPPNDAYWVEDGTRSLNQAFRANVDALLVKLIQEFTPDNLSTYVSVDDCLKIILPELEEKKLARLNVRR